MVCLQSSPFFAIHRNVERADIGPTRSRSWVLLASDVVLLEEFLDVLRNLNTMCLKREVSCVEHVRLDVPEIAAVRGSSLCRKDVVVLPPHNQGRRLIQ